MDLRDTIFGRTLVSTYASSYDYLNDCEFTSLRPDPTICSVLASHVNLMTLQPIIMIWVNAESILLFLRQDPEIARLAGMYLRWFSLGLPAYGINAILRYVIGLFFCCFARLCVLDA
jgi:MATE family multidrug resistance protein